MKKFFGCVVLFILVIITLTRVKPALAGVASHATTPYGTGVSILENPNVQSTPESFGFDIQGEIIPVAESILKGLQDKQIAIPNVHPYAVFNQSAADKSIPANVKNNIIPFTNDNPVSAKYCVRIVIKPPLMAAPPNAYDVTLTTTEKSEDWKDAKLAGQNEELLASWNGRWAKVPGVPAKPSRDPSDNASGDVGQQNANIPPNAYDYNYPTHVISNILPGDCDMQDPAVPVPHDALVAVSTARFDPGCPNYGTTCSYYYPWYYNGPDTAHTVCGYDKKLGESVCRLEWDTGNVSFRFDITRKSGDSAFTNLQAKTGRCFAKDTSDPQTAAICDENGQWTSGMVPASVFAGPFDPHAEVDQGVKFTAQGGAHIATVDKTVTLQTAFKNTHSAMEDTKTAICFNTPASLNNPTSVDYNTMVFGDPNAKDGTVSYAGNCGPTPQPVGNCPIDVIATMPDPGNSCNLCNTGGYVSFLNSVNSTYGASLPNGVPPLMQKVLNIAAATYHIPASLLLGTMLEEGAFVHPDTWKWTDDTVKTWSNCQVKDPLPSCNFFASGQGAVPPFGFIDTFWQTYMDTGGPYKGKSYKVTDPDLVKAADYAKPNYSACNFTDAAFTSAREISEDQSHYYVDQPPINTPLPAQCGGTTLSTDRFSPASCTQWTPDRVAMMRMQYGERVCTADVAGSVARMVKTFNAYTCNAGP